MYTLADFSESLCSRSCLFIRVIGRRLMLRFRSWNHCYLKVSSLVYARNMIVSKVHIRAHAWATSSFLFPFLFSISRFIHCPLTLINRYFRDIITTFYSHSPFSRGGSYRSAISSSLRTLTRKILTIFFELLYPLRDNRIFIRFIFAMFIYL